jgi:trimeric autotransporter adhesin
MAVTNLNPGDLYFADKFNDASREIEGGLWHNVVVDGNQGHGTDVRVTNDLHVVQAGLQADVAAGDFSGQQLTDVNTILSDLATELANISGAVNNDPASEQALRTAHLDIINVVNNDAALQTLSVDAVTGNPGFNFTPPQMATPVTNHTPHATFAELGVIFDDAQSRFLGGLNSTPDGAAQIQKDLTIVENGLIKLMADHPEQFQGATGIHAQTIVDQIHLQLTNFDHQYGFNVDAARSTNDNLLDITDIVSADTNLSNMAHAFGVNGWTPAVATDVKPTPFADNAAQTNFWADFIASGNVLGAKAEQLVQTGTKAAITAFEHVLTGWETNIGNFDAAQGGIFSARFDNELANGPNSTVGADVAAMINGLNTHNATLVTAAAEGFHANAADVSGNNMPVNGGTFNADGLTIAQALINTVAPPPPATFLTPATPAVSLPPAPQTPHGNDEVASMHQVADMHHNFHFDLHA